MAMEIFLIAKERVGFLDKPDHNDGFAVFPPTDTLLSLFSALSFKYVSALRVV